MIKSQRIFSLGGPYIIINENDASKWFGATSDESIQYDELVECIVNSQQEEFNILESKIANIRLVTIVNPSMIYKINEYKYIQIEAVLNDNKINTNKLLDEIDNFNPIYTKDYNIFLNEGNYYIFDSAWEFFEIKDDNNLFEIKLDKNVENITVNYYETESFDGWLITFNL